MSETPLLLPLILHSPWTLRVSFFEAAVQLVLVLVLLLLAAAAAAAAAAAEVHQK